MMDKLRLLRTTTMIVAGTLVPLVAHAQGRLDAIAMHGDAPAIRGTITDMRPMEVTIQEGSKSRTVPVNEIRYIAFADDVTGLREARQEVDEGQYESALQKLSRMKVEEIKNDYVKQDVIFYQSLCKGRMSLQDGNGLTEAAGEILEFVKANRNTYHFLEAAELLGDLAMQLGEFPAAGKYYAQLSRTPFPDLKLRGSVMEASALQASGDHQSAMKQYRQAMDVNAGGEQSEQYRQLAKAGVAACQAEAGDPEAAIRTAQEVIDKNPPTQTRLFARAYNAMGAGYRKQGNVKEAVLAYLHVDLLFSQDPLAHAESLYYLSDLLGKVGKANRGTQARATLKSRYAQTTWAQE